MGKDSQGLYGESVRIEVSSNYIVKFNAWYMGMLLPLALLLEDDYWLRRLVVLITCTELLSLTFFKQAYIINYFALILVPTLVVWRQKRKLVSSAEREATAKDAILPAPS